MSEKMNIDYGYIIKLFENNIGPLSVAGTPLDKFFAKIPNANRAEAEYFIRTELGGDPINEMDEILPGQYWNSRGIENFVIPATIKKCAEGVFKGSDLQNVKICSPLDGTVNLDIFAGASNLSSVEIDPSISSQIKSIDVKVLAANNCASMPKFKLKLPKAIMDGLENGTVDFNGTNGFMEYLMEPGVLTII